MYLDAPDPARGIVVYLRQYRVGILHKHTEQNTHMFKSLLKLYCYLLLLIKIKEMCLESDHFTKIVVNNIISYILHS